MSPPLAEVEIRRGVVVARPECDLDLATADPLTAAIADAVPNAALGLVIDLVRVRYIDSAGVRMLFTLLARLRVRQQDMRVAVARDVPLRRILTIVGLDSAMPVHDEVEDAVSALIDARFTSHQHDAEPA